MNSHKTDPVDHHRTFRRHAGETVTNGANAPGLAGSALAVLALIVGLFAFATGGVAVACTPEGAEGRTGLARREFRRARPTADQLTPAS